MLRAEQHHEAGDERTTSCHRPTHVDGGCEAEAGREPEAFAPTLEARDGDQQTPEGGQCSRNGRPASVRHAPFERRGLLRGVVAPVG